MAATSFADYMARVSASMIHAALVNAAEKAAAHHQQQQQQHAQSQQQGRSVPVEAGTACASPPLVPFFPLPLLALPPGTLQLQPHQQQANKDGIMKTNCVQNAAKGERQKQQKQNEEDKATQNQSSAKTTTTAKANGNDGGGGRGTNETPFNNSSREEDGGRGGGKQQQKEDTKQQQQQQKTQSDGPKKRKKPFRSLETEAEPPKQQLMTVNAEPSQQSSESPLSSSRISSPESVVHRNGNGRGARKLKLYVAEEKVDIIDYAKCIGNRAAGREFNVAESSIREWRKNEEKIRRQAESTLGCTQHFEQSQPDLLAWVDDQLVRTIVSEKGEQCTATTDWYTIADSARQLWMEKVAISGYLDGSEMKITMGWVSRFMRRNEYRVPKIAPPIIATGNAPSNSAAAPSASGSATGTTRANGTAGAAMSMVKSNSKAKLRQQQKNADWEEEEETRPKVRPKRTTGSTGRAALPPMNERPPAKKAKTSNGSAKANNGTEKTKTILDNANSVSSSPAVAHNQQTNAVPTPPSSRRRKCLKPMRVDATCATLLTTSRPTDIDQSDVTSS